MRPSLTHKRLEDVRRVVVLNDVILNGRFSVNKP